jgi:hypothetical protein
MRYLWYSMYAFVTALAVYSLFFAPSRRQPTPPPATGKTPATAPSEEAAVQIALLLDTSTSMDGLIEQARTQLWEIVGALQTDDKDQERTVSVALYRYGDRSGTIEQVSELTSNLDAVSVKLHTLTTSGGREHHPEAIARAGSRSSETRACFHLLDALRVS